MKKTISLLLSVIFMISFLMTSAYAEAGMSNFKKTLTYRTGLYTDVSSGDWFSINVSDAYEYDIMNGVSGNVFGATSNVKLSEVIAIAARIHSIYTTGKAEFSASTPWYQSYVDYAAANGIISENRFENLELFASRYQVAEIFAAALPTSALGAINSINVGDIPDVSLETPYQCIYTLYWAGVLTGKTSSGAFCPSDNVQRCEIAAIATRMANESLRVKFTINKSASGENSSGAQVLSTVNLARQSVVLASDSYTAANIGFASGIPANAVAAEAALNSAYEYTLMAAQHAMTAAEFCKSNSKYSSAYDDIYNSYLACQAAVTYIQKVAAAPVAPSTDWLTAKSLISGSGEALSRAYDAISKKG